MKNLILQVCIPNEKVFEVGKGSMFAYIPEMYQECSNDAKEYADNIGAEYHLMTTHEWREDFHPKFQRYAAFFEKYDEYDNIVCLDGDYAPNPNSPDIFEIMNASESIWFAVPDNKYDKEGNMKKMRKQSFDKFELDYAFHYFNIGFYGMKRESRMIMRQKINEHFSGDRKEYNFEDQDLLNKIVFENMDERYERMNKNWNGVFSIKTPDFATHYAGMAKQNFTVEGHRKLKAEKMARTGGEIFHVPQWSTDIMKGESLNAFFS